VFINKSEFRGRRLGAVPFWGEET